MPVVEWESASGRPVLRKDVEPLAELLAEDLAEWPDDAWLAFDDYQFATESPFAEEFVERVLALCPAQALPHEPQASELGDVAPHPLRRHLRDGPQPPGDEPGRA